MPEDRFNLDTVRVLLSPPGGIELREPSSPRREGGQPAVMDEDKVAEHQERALRCRICGAAVTTARERIEKEGKHLHTFFNPAGIVYEIGSFKKAPGAVPFGDLSGEFSWFTGYRWRVAYCVECFEHLGWRFIRDTDFFFGLIVSRLIES